MVEYEERGQLIAVFSAVSHQLVDILYIALADSEDPRCLFAVEHSADVLMQMRSELSAVVIAVVF